MSRIPLLLVVVALSLTASANGQLFNIDMSDPGGPGAPDMTYGAAAGQIGFWNNLADGNAIGAPLLDLAGGATGASISFDGGFMGAFMGPNSAATIAGSNGERLLDDGWDPSATEGIITISGLAPGTYSIYTYGVAPDSITDLTAFSVVGSIEGTTVDVGGALGPPDSFLDTYSVPTTHAIFTKTIAPAEDLIINVGNRGGEFETVNGIQITPEPGSVCLLAMGAFALIRRRR